MMKIVVAMKTVSVTTKNKIIETILTPNTLQIEMKEYAKENKVPIILDDGLRLLLWAIRTYKIKNILEIGTAIGYSGIAMATEDIDLLRTYERDSLMYEEAKKNVSKSEFQDKIELVFGDALLIEENLEPIYDMIFIDAAKAQYLNFFKKYEPYLKKGGIIITDNLNFHNLKIEEAKTRSLRGLLRKIESYKEFLATNDDYDTTFFDLGDGMSISLKK